MNGIDGEKSACTVQNEQMHRVFGDAQISKRHHPNYCDLSGVLEMVLT